MLRYFRKIRQSLLVQNRFTRYLTYAVGEIILVVIGILCAVQINGWNEERKNQKLEIVLLEKIHQDLEIQLEIIDTQLIHEKTMISLCDSANKYFQGSISMNTLHSLLDKVSTRLTFIANKATFNSMNTTGNLVFIRNDELQEEIIRYYQQLDYASQVINNNNLHKIDDQFGQALTTNHVGLRLLDNKEVDLSYELNGEQLYILSSMLKTRMAASSSIKRNTIKLRTQTVELMDLIEKELSEQQ
jgi:hypothetical protein